MYTANTLRNERKGGREGEKEQYSSQREAICGNRAEVCWAGRAIAGRQPPRVEELTV